MEQVSGVSSAALLCVLDVSSPAAAPVCGPDGLSGRQREPARTLAPVSLALCLAARIGHRVWIDSL